ncbi:MAG: sulfite exporter TauE/SafE family protein [Polaromonas sp.]|nr:sulfite exporter TauE/SafE family protein [Polaromonas sp.]
MGAALAATALLMGLAGGPHCVAMCGAACAGIGRSQAGAGSRALWLFQAGRVAGYSALGGVAAASMQAVGWLSVHAAALRPVWTLFHVAAAVMGLVLLCQARQPVWIEQAARSVWSSVSGAARRSGASAPLMLGACWALLPCGLLYSALLVAGLTGRPAAGAGAMALFAMGSGVSLMAGPWLWLRLRRPGSGRWATRLAGLALLGSSTSALWLALVHDAAPWCITP